MKSQKRTSNTARNKKQGQFWHAKQRVKQRFKYSLRRVEYDKILKRVWKGEFEYIGKYTNRVVLYKAKLWGYTVILICDCIRESIVSVIRPSQIQRGKLMEAKECK